MVIMDDKTQKERLEQELRFLKESFEAEVISREEVEKGKERIEKKLKEIVEVAEAEQPKKEQGPAQEKAEEIKKDDVIETKAEGKIKLNVIQDESSEPHEQGHAYGAPESIIHQEKIQEPLKEPREEKKKSKFFKYSLIFAVLALVIFFVYPFFKGDVLKPQEKQTHAEFVAACASNDGCMQEGKEGFCINPRAKDARCEFKTVQKINVLVLNDRKSCFNCDTQRVLNILEEWFEDLNSKEIDYGTAEGKAAAEMFNVKLLPAYILDENITKKQSFGQFKQAFAKKDRSYVLSEYASGSTFYFKRESIPNKLDLFVVSGDGAAMKAENNMKEFLDAFAEAKFEKHFSNDNLTKELGIKTFPAFLINNRVRFSGINSAETIKENFCKLNKLKECGKSLSKSLV